MGMKRYKQVNAIATGEIEILVSADTTIADDTWVDLGSQFTTRGVPYISFFVKLAEAGAEITEVRIRAQLARESAGDEIIEPKYAGDQETVSDRVHNFLIGNISSLANTGGQIGGVISTLGLLYCTIQIYVLTSGIAEPIINEAYAELLS